MSSFVPYMHHILHPVAFALLIMTTVKDGLVQNVIAAQDLDIVY